MPGNESQGSDTRPPVSAVRQNRHNYRVLQAGRGLAALAVVGFHANVVCALPKYFGHEPAAVFGAGDSGVEFFFVLSGLVMVLAHRAELGQPGSPGRFLWKRFRRIYPPLWVMLCLVIAILAAIPGLPSGGVPHAGALIDAFAAGPVNPLAPEPLLAVEWTLRREMLFYVLFAGLLWRWRPGLVVMVVWLMLCGLAAFMTMPFPGSFPFDPVHVLFGMGMLVGWRVLRTPGDAYAGAAGRRAGDWLLVAAGAALFAAAWTGSVVSPAVHASPFALWCYGLGASALILGLIALERRGAVVVPAALNALGDASYSIYLVHFIVVSAATKVAVMLGRHISLPGVVWWLAIVAAGVLAGFAFFALVERPLVRRLGKRE